MLIYKTKCVLLLLLLSTGVWFVGCLSAIFRAFAGSQGPGHCGAVCAHESREWPGRREVQEAPKVSLFWAIY